MGKQKLETFGLKNQYGVIVMHEEDDALNEQVYEVLTRALAEAELADRVKVRVTAI